MSEEKKIIKGSKRRAYADRVSNEIPFHLGRDTKTFSNNQLKSLGRANDIKMW